jgi:thymidine kinase
MANEGKHVIIAALDGDYKREPFGDVLNLIPKAESVCKLNSVCMLCGNDANFTQRIGKQTQTIIVGGQELYRPLCRKCYFQK